MCRMVGFRSVCNFKALRDFLPEATASLAHGGPGDSGLFYEESYGVGLCHQRLSVIDLSGQINHHYRLWALLMWEMWRER